MIRQSLVPRLRVGVPYAAVVGAIAAVAMIAGLPLVLWLVSNSGRALGSAYFYLFLLPPTVLALGAGILAFAPIAGRRRPWWALIPAGAAIVGVLLLTVWKPLLGQMQL